MNYQWLEKLHKEHYATLLRLARNQLYRRTGSAADAEDIVQEAFLLAAEKDISTHEAPLKWLMKTVGNLCMGRTQKVLREQQKQQRIIQQRMDNSADRSIYAIERQCSETELKETLLTLEQTLSAEDWELMNQLYLQGRSQEAVAQERGVPANTLRVRVCRIRKKLNEILRGM